MSAAYKTCTCCGVAYTELGWWALPPPKKGALIDREDGTWDVYRDCPCRGTMTVRVGHGIGSSRTELEGLFMHVCDESDGKILAAWDRLQAGKAAL